MGFILELIGKILLQVLIKFILTIFSKELIGQLMFACLHRLAKLTSTTKDDEFIDKLEHLYYGISDCTDQQSEELIRKIKSKGNDN